MKFEMESVEMESSGAISESQFGIKDMGFILHLLRSKIYSDIKKAICQEYTCNARDAHREAGKAEIPIEITLPTHFESNFRVRDFGNSISPENMIKVFIQYGASTKRESNAFTGGFGIGCKTAFGYTDAFIVNTFINGIHRSYSCVIDDTRCGKLVLLSETATTQPNGTEIVVPIEARDISSFIKETHRSCRHWDVKPIIHGGAVEWNDFTGNILLEGTNWFVTRDLNGNREIRAVVDGVEYPCNLSQLGIENPLRFGYSTTLYLKFPVGVLAVSANREQLETDDVTKKRISAKLNEVKAELLARFEDAIKDSKTFLEANLALHKITSSLNMEIPKDLTWNGVELFGKAVNLDSGTLVTYERTAKGAKKSSKYTSSHLEFTDKTLYCTTDLDFNKNVENGAAAIFRAFPGFNNLVMIRFHDDKEIQKKNLHLMNFLKLSDYYTAKTRKASLGRLMFFKFNGNTTFSRSSLKEYETDTNKKLWCQVNKTKSYGGPENGLVVKFGANEHHNNEGLNALLKMVGGETSSLYGFSTEIPEDRLEEATEEMESFEEIVAAHLVSENVDLGEVKFAIAADRRKIFLFDEEEEKKLSKRIAEIKNVNSSLISYITGGSEFGKKISKLQKYGFVLQASKNMTHEKNFCLSIKTNGAEALKDYPLFRYMAYRKDNSYGDYYSREISPEITEIIEYVNTVDMASGKV